MKQFLLRLLAASSFAFAIGAGLLVYSAYKDRAAGASVWNVSRCLVAGGMVALAVKGTRLRHGAQSGGQGGADRGE